MTVGREEDLLNPEKALLFRITHRDNLPWILDQGLHCARTVQQDPDFVAIGNEELIDKRLDWPVPVAPGGCLGDYVPFYFTPWSPMLLNILTGRGVRRREPDEIVFVISSAHGLARSGVALVFTDRHAYLRAANFSSHLQDLGTLVPWDALQKRDFKKDPLRPQAFERYQAEALAHRHVP